MTEAEHVELLRVIRALALLAYPYPDGAPPVATKYLLALGQIAGIADDALSLLCGTDTTSGGAARLAEPQTGDH
jgi:hypothetical protein